MKIQLKQSDIDSGVPCNGYRCGFALALNRQLPGGPWHVGCDGIVRNATRLQNGGFIKRIAQLPHEAVEAIALYDSRGDHGKRLVMPFNFELDVQKNQEPERKTI